METIQTNVEKIIKKGVISSMAAGALPVPVIDVALVVGAQVNMIKELCEVYQVAYSKEKINTWIMSILSGTVLWRFGGTALKGIPVVGWLVGGATLAVTSGASTYAVGQLAIKYLDRNQSLEDINMEEARSSFKEEFARGKDFIENMNEEETTIETETEIIFEEKNESAELLKKLENLKEAGILTDKEFERKKKKISKIYPN